MKNICKNCGKEYEFEPKRGTYKFSYCSMKCRAEYNAKDKLPQTRICEHCGKEYWWDGTSDRYIKGKIAIDSKRFCSFECGKAYKYEKAKKSTIEKYGAIGFGVKELRDKGRQTSLEKYGSETYNNRESAKQTTLSKYGVENISQSQENKEKIKEAWKNKTEEELQEITNKHIKTNQERYGVDYVSQLEEIKKKVSEVWSNKSQEEIKDIINKRENSTLEHYNVKHYSETDEFKENIKNSWKNKTEEELQEITNKRIKTNQERYGVEFPQSLSEIKEKIEITNLKKYGNKVAIKSDIIQNKVKQTNLKKYGVEYAVGSNEVQKHIRETNIKKYNYEYPFQSKNLREIMEKNRKKTNIKKYGTPNIIQVDEFKEKAKQTCLKKYGVEYNCLTENCINANSNQISNKNKKFKELLDKLNINNELEFRLENKSFDILVNNEYLVEIDPTYTHQSTMILPLAKYKVNPKDPDYHLNKSKLAEENNYRCIHIFDWDSPYKIAQMLKTKKTIYARNLIIANVSKNEIKTFLNQYHLQGSCNNQSICLGLYKNTELIEVMTFGKPRYNKKYEYELLRLCTKAEYKVVGGAERLFKYFINTYKPTSIISYCDNSKFTGNVYKRLGMKLEDEGKPSKHWFNINTARHITDNLLRQRGYSQLHNDTEHKKGESNEQLMLEAGYLEVYDCGQSTYTWKNKNL